MSESDTWWRPSLSGCSAVQHMIRVPAAERCLLSCCPGVFPTGMLLAITGCQLGEGILNWFNLRCSLSWLLYLSIKEEERSVCPCDIRFFKNLLGLTVALLSTTSQANMWHNSGKSHGFIRIDLNSGPYVKTTGMTTGDASIGTVRLGSSRI